MYNHYTLFGECSVSNQIIFTANLKRTCDITWKRTVKLMMLIKKNPLGFLLIPIDIGKAVGIRSTINISSNSSNNDNRILITRKNLYTCILKVKDKACALKRR